MTRGFGMVLLGSMLMFASTAEAQLVVTSNYTLPASLTDGTNIQITASNVILNLNGKVVKCSASSPTSVGIDVSSSVSGVTIRNGSVTGCYAGISATGASNLTIENVDFTGNTYMGLNIAYAGSGNVVKGSTFAAIAGYAASAYAVGINGAGNGAVIEDNRFSNLYRQPSVSGTGEGTAIIVQGNSTGVSIRRNTFTNDIVSPFTIGVWVAGGSSAEIKENNLTNFKFGVQSGSGIATVSRNTFVMSQTLAGSIAVDSVGVASNNSITGYNTLLGVNTTDGGGNGTPSAPAPVPTPGPNGRWFRICVDNGSTCYQGTLLPAPPGGV